MHQATTNTKDSLCRATDKRIALTFDDGPNDLAALSILDILQRYHVRATFFCIGSEAQKHPEILRRMAADGHVIGNHSYSHPDLTKETNDEVRRQLEHTCDIIEETVGLHPRLFRPPFGNVDDRVKNAAQDSHVVLWNVDSQDWRRIPGPAIAANVLASLQEESIVLLHCFEDAHGTVEALPYLIEVGSALGYQFVTADAILGVPAY